MSEIGIREMLETGAHFGHQTYRWNPKMRKYIFGSRNKIHIIDLQQTVYYFKTAYNFIFNIVLRGGKVLFVGTKRQAQDIIAEEAIRSQQFYINNRWLGGMLTNFKTIKQSVDRLKKIENMSIDGTFEKLPKKEVLGLSKEISKLKKNLKGIKNMKKLPKVVFVVDPKKEYIAVSEAKKLNIPVVAIVDTNCDPDDINYIIPANDDSFRSIKLFVGKMSSACLQASMKREQMLAEKKVEDAIKIKNNIKQKSFTSSYKDYRGLEVDIIHFRKKDIDKDRSV